MDEINKIRKDHYSKEKNRNQIAQKFNRSWATVDSYLTKSPEELKTIGQRPNRISHLKNEEVKKFIQDHLLEEIEKNIRPKQRYTACVLFQKALDKGIFQGTERYFRIIVNEQRTLIHQLKNPPKSFLELDFPFGEYLQMDHGPVEVELDGHRFDSYLFCASVPGATLRFCQVYLTKAQESWGDFHEKCFEFFGGIFPKVIDDNDTVLKIPSTGEKTSFALELEKHYGIELIFCNKASGWEKGAVENAVGTCRRNFLPGVPSFANQKELNGHLNKKCLDQIEKGNHYNTQEPLIELKKRIQEKLLPLKPSFVWGIWEDLDVNSWQCTTYKSHRYSVPERYVGFGLKAHISAVGVSFYDGDILVAQHERKFLKGEDSLLLDHYLDQLEKKPRSIPFAKVMVKQKFPEYLKEIREALNRKFPSNTAGLEFVKILKERRKCSLNDFEAAIRLGLNYGGITHSAIVSFISQLQITQTILHCPKELLPPQCPTGLEQFFNLSGYTQLEGEGGQQ